MSTRDDLRGTGQTTGLMECAIDLIAEGHEVYITGAHTDWLRQLEREFRAAGLVGVHFLPRGSLHRAAVGCRGRLLVDDFDDLSLADMRAIMQARRRIEW